MALYDPYNELAGEEARAFLDHIENPRHNANAARFRAYVEATFGKGA